MKLPEFMEKEIRESIKMRLGFIRSKCKTCGGQGVIIDETKGTFRDCADCMGKTSKYSAYSFAGIRDEQHMSLTEKRLHDTLQEKVFQQALQLKEQILTVLSKRGIIFSMKSVKDDDTTSLAIYLIKHLIKRDLNCYTVKIDAIIDCFFSFKDTMEEVAHKRQQMMEFYSTVPILHIDELGIELERTKNGSMFVANRFLKFLQLRESRGLKTMFSTIFTKEDLFKYYDTPYQILFAQKFVIFVVENKQCPTNLKDELGDAASLFVPAKPTVTIKKTP